MKEKHICSTIINDKASRDIITKMINGQADDKCGCNAKFFEDGEWYCGRHAPSKIKEREDKSYAKWVAQVAERKKHRLMFGEQPEEGRKVLVKCYGDSKIIKGVLSKNGKHVTTVMGSKHYAKNVQVWDYIDANVEIARRHNDGLDEIDELITKNNELLINLTKSF